MAKITTTRRSGEADQLKLTAFKRQHAEIIARDRALAIVLEALSTRYLPRILQKLSSPDDDLDSYVWSADPREESEFLALLAKEKLLSQAELLLNQAKTIDPLGKWHRVTRVGTPSRWSELRYDALIAQEMRIGAELLLRFLEDEARYGRAQPLADLSETNWQPRHDRLKVTSRERSETVMDFRLSDRPAIYLALEGQTEVLLVNKLLAMVGYDELSTWVTIVDMEGVDKDHRLLARSLAVPRLDPDGFVGARLKAPLAALFIASDPEKKYESEAQRSKIRDDMIEEIMKSLPTQLNIDSTKDDLRHLVHVRAWPSEFEFAHFSDTELARALRRLVAGAPPHREVMSALKKCRATNVNIKKVWKDWPTRPSKVRLAEMLWPDLKRKIDNPRKRQSLPIVEMLDEALLVAQQARRIREIGPRDR